MALVKVVPPESMRPILADTNLGPAEKGIYANGDLPSLFSIVKRNGSKTCQANEKQGTKRNSVLPISTITTLRSLKSK